jgi:type 1 glutamine amidotransferase
MLHPVPHQIHSLFAALRASLYPQRTADRGLLVDAAQRSHMHTKTIGQLLVAGASAMAFIAAVSGSLTAQQPAAGAAAGAAQGAGARAGGAGGGRGGPGVAPALFTSVDANRDGVVTREELRATMERWHADANTANAASITPAQLSAVLTARFPAPPPPPPPTCGTGIHTPCPQHVAAMMAALPDKAYATPLRPRKLLVYGIDNNTPARGFVHSSIAIQAEMMRAMGEKLGTWTTTISYDPAVFTTANLAQYDAILLDSTTGCFLDAPGDPATTAARRAALLEFVRGGKGLGGIHASTDAYRSPCPNDAPAAGARVGGGGAAAAGGRAGGAAAGGGRAGGAGGPGGQLATSVMTQADKDTNQQLTLAEMTVLANEWFDKMDADKTGRIAQADFAARYAAAQPAPAGRGGAGRGAAGAPTVARGSTRLPATGTWPEYNKMIGGYFKYHWNNGTHIPVKVDDPTSPLTVMFGGQGFEVIDETYTFAQDSFSRTNVRVLTSVDYDKMPQATKDQEPAATARTDGDYALSYIRREGQGRVFYAASGHDESIYAMKNMSQHYLALMQYAMGDLKADDSPSVPAAR